MTWTGMLQARPPPPPMDVPAPRNVLSHSCQALCFGTGCSQTRGTMRPYAIDPQRPSVPHESSLPASIQLKHGPHPQEVFPDGHSEQGPSPVLLEHCRISIILLLNHKRCLSLLLECDRSLPSISAPLATNTLRGTSSIIRSSIQQVWSACSRPGPPLARGLGSVPGRCASLWAVAPQL